MQQLVGGRSFNAEQMQRDVLDEVGEYVDFGYSFGAPVSARSGFSLLADLEGARNAVVGLCRCVFSGSWEKV